VIQAITSLKAPATLSKIDYGVLIKTTDTKVRTLPELSGVKRMYDSCRTATNVQHHEQARNKLQLGYAMGFYYIPIIIVGFSFKMAGTKFPTDTKFTSSDARLPH